MATFQKLLARTYLSPTQHLEKVVIIGGSGFLGNYMAKAFIADPFTKVRLINRTGTNPESLKRLGTQLLPPQAGDITQPDQMLRACEGATVVINLVGIMHESKPKYTFEAVQHIGAANVAKAAQANQAKLIHVSAIGADPKSDIPYCRTKGLGEEVVREICPEATILRPSLVFGPEDDFFNRLAKLARMLPVVPVFGGGKSLFQPIYVWDVARAAKLAHVGPFNGKTVELGGPTVYTYREMMQMMLDQAGLRRPIMSLPFAVGKFQGLILEQLPLNLFTLTRDQVKLLSLDNIVNPNSLNLKDLGIQGTPAERVLHTYLRMDASQLTTPNKRTHKMQSQDLEKELERIRATGGSRPNAPNLEEQLKYHMTRKDSQIKQ